MAAACFQHCAIQAGLTDLEADSAGLHVHGRGQIAPAASQAMKAAGIQPLRLGVQQLSMKLTKTADLILCMTSRQQHELTARYFSAERKTLTLMSLANSAYNILEPRDPDTEKCAQCLERMQPAIRQLIEKLA